MDNEDDNAEEVDDESNGEEEDGKIRMESIKITKYSK